MWGNLHHLHNSGENSNIPNGVSFVRLNELTVHSRLLSGILAIFLSEVVVAVVSAIYIYGPPPPLVRLLERPMTEPSAEEYAVLSGFMDDFFTSKQPFRLDQSIRANAVIYIAADTVRMQDLGSILPLQVAVLGPEDMGHDFFRQNARTWHLQPRFHTKFRTILVDSSIARRAALSGVEELFETPENRRNWLPHPSAAGPFADARDVSGVMELSRVGLNRRRTLAILNYSYRCGLLCGQSGWVVLHKINSQWRVKEFGSTLVY